MVLLRIKGAALEHKGARKSLAASKSPARPDTPHLPPKSAHRTRMRPRPSPTTVGVKPYASSTASNSRLRVCTPAASVSVTSFRASVANSTQTESAEGRTVLG